MASKRISELPAATALDGSEQIPLTQAGETRRTDGSAWQYHHMEDVAHDHGAVLDDTTDDSAAIQSAVDALGGERGIVLIPGRAFCNASVDFKQATLMGVGAPHDTNGPRLRFSGTTQLHTSVEQNYGPVIVNLEIRGSAADETDQNGQTLVDLTGVNYPAMIRVRLWNAQTVLLLAQGTNIGCFHGEFYSVDVHNSYAGVQIGDAGGNANSHTFYGGRWWQNTTACMLDAGNNIAWVGTAFESNDTGVDSAGSDVSFAVCRFENPTNTASLNIRSGAGSHYSWGNHWSSGTNVVDANSPSVLRSVEPELFQSFLHRQRETWISDSFSEHLALDRNGHLVHITQMFDGKLAITWENDPDHGTETRLTLDTTGHLDHNSGSITRVGENAGTATFSGDGSTVTFAVPHGLASAPTARAVWGESADAAGDKYVSSVDGTNINVTFAAAPASGTDNVVLGFDARV